CFRSTARNGYRQRKITHFLSDRTRPCLHRHMSNVGLAGQTGSDRNPRTRRGTAEKRFPGSRSSARADRQDRSIPTGGPHLRQPLRRWRPTRRKHMRWTEDRREALCSLLWLSSVRSLVPPSPVLRDANADQPRIGCEHICGQPAIVTVEERACYISGVEHVLVVEHHLPAPLVCQDQREVHVGIAAQPVIGIVVENARPGIVLPIVIGAQRSGPIFGYRQRVLGASRQRERRCVGQFITA